MPVISILIPFRDTGDRKKQFEWLQKRWATEFPEAEVIVESDDGKDPFSKTMAVNNCYRKATSDILALVDADCWVDPKILIKAAEEIRAGNASWVRPCKTVYRLTKSFTMKIVASDKKSFPKVDPEKDTERITPNVGAVTVFSRKQFEAVGGMDERFRGWGWEDSAFNMVLDKKFGKAQIWDNIVYHFWHPRLRSDTNRPIWPGQTNTNEKVGKKYSKAKTSRILLDKLIRENKSRNNI